MKKLTISLMGEKFELELEDEFFEFVKNDLVKLQHSTPKELLFLILQKNKKEFEINKKLTNLLKKIENT